MSSSPLAFRLSRAVLNTIRPPVPRAKAWGLAYPSTPARPLLDMSQGAPSNSPPDILLNALAMTSPSPQCSGYGHGLGELTLRTILAQEMKTVYGKDADITSNDVAITAGCNMAFMAAVMCLADAANEVILPVPWYFCHAMSLNLLGIKPIPLYTRSDQGFLPSLEECKSLITPKTKAISIVTPNNPTGAIYTPALISQFAELAREHNIALIIDETYRDFVEHFPPHNLFASSWRANVVHLFSFSKSYAIPGHRLGAVVASPELLEHLTTTLDCIQVCPPRPPQLALANASLLAELRPSIQSNAKELKVRHALFRKLLPPGWIIGSQGGFFAFAKYPFQNIASTTFCERLAKEMGVLALPARFFYGEDEVQNQGQSEEGWDRWVRFSVPNVGDEQIEEVCERLKECSRHFE